MAISQTSRGLTPGARSDVGVRHHRQDDEGHRQQHQRRAQFRPGDARDPAVDFRARRQDAGDGDRRGGGHPQVAGDRIGAEDEGQQFGDDGGGGIAAGGAVGVALEHRDHAGIDGKAEAEDQPGGDAGPDRLRQRRCEAAEQAADGKGAHARGAMAGRDFTRLPAALEADQEADAERDRQPREQMIDIHADGFRRSAPCLAQTAAHGKRRRQNERSRPVAGPAPPWAANVSSASAHW